MQVWTNSTVTEYRRGRRRDRHGANPAATVLWAAGVKASPLGSRPAGLKSIARAA